MPRRPWLGQRGDLDPLHPCVRCPLRGHSESKSDVLLLVPHLWVFVLPTQFCLTQRTHDHLRPLLFLAVWGWWGGSWHLQGSALSCWEGFSPCGVQAGPPGVGGEALLWAGPGGGQAGRHTPQANISQVGPLLPRLLGHCPGTSPGARCWPGVELVVSGQSTPQIRNSLLFLTWHLTGGCCGQ